MSKVHKVDGTRKPSWLGEDITPYVVLRKGALLTVDIYVDAPCVLLSNEWVLKFE